MVFLCPFDHLYVSLVKLYNFLCPLSIITKKGEKMWFLEILHVRGSNTCLCKGELCFICLEGEHDVLWGSVPIFYWYTYS